MKTAADGVEPVAAASGNAGRDQDVAIVWPQVQAHVALLHERARGIPGKLIVACFGEKPSSKKAMTPKVGQFHVGDVDGTRKFIQLRSIERHRNIYMSIAVMRPDLPPHHKGEEADVVAVLGVVADFDALTKEKGPDGKLHSSHQDVSRWRDDLPLPPSFVLRTSTLPVPSYQAFFLYDKPLTDLAEAKARAVGLTQHTKCDNTSQDISHVFRIPGLPNWPKADKIAAGRPPEPQLVCVELPYADVLVDPRKLPAPTAMPAAVAVAGHIEDVPIPDRFEKDLESDEPLRLRWEGDATGLRDTSGSGFDMSLASMLFRRGYARAEVAAILSAFPHGKKEKDRRYIERTLDKAGAFSERFDTDKDDKVAKTQRNVRLALHKLGVELAFDEFAERPTVSGLTGFGPALGDGAMDRMYLQCDERFKLLPEVTFFEKVVKDLARRNTVHPVRDYLDGLVWDSKLRIDAWLTTYGGAVDTPYTRAVGSIVLIAAVRRVRTPGCKYDEMLVLESPQQGTEKSTALATLCPDAAWFTDDLPLSVGSKETIERTAGKWIIEAAELSGLRKTQNEHLKAFMSRRVDGPARLAWGRLPTERPRHFVVIGTTNAQAYLRDKTGNRRFWPVRITKFDIEALRRDRDQLWAEAAAREAAGESIRLDPALYPAAAREQRSRESGDAWDDRLQDLLGDHKGRIRSEDVWAIVEVPIGQRSQEHNERLGNAMRAMGWARPDSGVRFGGGGKKGYVRGDKVERKRVLTVVRDGHGHVTHVAFARTKDTEDLFDDDDNDDDDDVS